jgi:hypothetical protein
MDRAVAQSHDQSALATWADLGIPSSCRVPDSMGRPDVEQRRRGPWATQRTEILAPRVQAIGFPYVVHNTTILAMSLRVGRLRIYFAIHPRHIPNERTSEPSACRLIRFNLARLQRASWPPYGNVRAFNWERPLWGMSNLEIERADITNQPFANERILIISDAPWAKVMPLLKMLAPRS